MRRIFGAIAVFVAASAMAQVATATERPTVPPRCQGQHDQQQGARAKDDMLKPCREARQNEQKQSRRQAAVEVSDEDFNGNGHQGHNH